jgi:hypothetical protein
MPAARRRPTSREYLVEIFGSIGLMPMSCSICSNSEAAVAVNELLFKGSTIDFVATETGVHRSSVARHKAKCFARWRANRLRDRKGKSDQPGVIFVQWPNSPTAPEHVRGTLIRNWDPTPVHPSQIRPSDALFVVRYANPLPERAKIETPTAPAAPVYDP